MCIEIEAKLKIDSFAPVTEKLTQLGAEFVEDQTQTDTYFDDADKSMAGGDKCLRIRTESVGSESRTFLTFKGPRENRRFKTRKEIDIRLGDADSAYKLLSALGYQQALIVEKNRSFWRYAGCKIGLDQLASLGKFVEIEGPDETRIADVQKKLGLENLPHIPVSYATLLTAKLKEQSSGA